MRILELDTLRQRGVRIIAALGWACALVVTVIAWVMGDGNTFWVALAAIAANIAPSLAAWRGRFDLAARLTVGTLAAIFPALGVYAMAGHPWQMDGHMYFFVALSALVILCDWRPLVVAGALVALHHLVLEKVAPAWVFTGTGNLGRVVVHGVAVMLEVAVLSYTSRSLRRLLQRQHDARLESERQSAIAEDRRLEVEIALGQARAAEARANAERDARLSGDREAARLRHLEMLEVAARFHQSVAHVVHSVGAATAELDESARALSALAGDATVRIEQSAVAIDRSYGEAKLLARQLKDLSLSVEAIADSVVDQAQLSAEARAASHASRASVSTLAERGGTISGFADSIQQIAARTNLLALNATIEAARAGEAGRGFAVVATEVKSLASQAGSASGEIRALVRSVDEGASTANDALQSIGQTVDRLSHAAATIEQEVRRHRETASAIHITAEEATARSEMIAGEIGGVVMLAGETARLSSQVSEAASGLSGSARDLQAATDAFITHLRAA